MREPGASERAGAVLLVASGSMVAQLTYTLASSFNYTTPVVVPCGIGLVYTSRSISYRGGEQLTVDRWRLVVWTGEHSNSMLQAMVRVSGVPRRTREPPTARQNHRGEIFFRQYRLYHRHRGETTLFITSVVVIALCCLPHPRKTVGHSSSPPHHPSRACKEIIGVCT